MHATVWLSYYFRWRHDWSFAICHEFSTVTLQSYHCPCQSLIFFFFVFIFLIFHIYKSGAVQCIFNGSINFLLLYFFCISWDQEWNVWRPRFLRSRQFWSFTANTAFDWRHTKHIDVGKKYEISTSSLIGMPSPTKPGKLFASVTSLNIDIEWCFHIFFPTRNVLFGGGW